MKELIHKLLRFISSDLRLLKEDYYIIGSCAMVLAGLPIQRTFDVDLLVSSNDAEILKKIWHDRKRENFELVGSDLFRSNFSRYKFDEIDIEVMGDLQVYKNGEWTPLQIDNYEAILIGNDSIKIPTLKDQQRIFNLFGREKDLLKAQMIEDHFTISPSISKK